MFLFDLSWDDFLTLLAKQVYAKSPVCLVVDRMVWQFSVSWTVKVDSLPLTSEEGFEYMISHLKASSLRAAGNLFIKMAKPTDGEAQLPPWAVKSVTTSEALLGKDKPSSSKCTVSLDKKLAPIVQQLQDTYPIGLCDCHPNLCCFHHGPTDRHYELIPTLEKVWAHAIVCLPLVI
ncbi:hypothetical protein F5J12DRAFT_725007 [Pisolithus orientalis]|uniref:uncharacterized protein n=1 Tax=Pisolithus orientalis TaxID=936130 RepID=UPI0022253C34|nr:uncharacterized protein F5J12DRAFT_725007 [Pisolithus orientalis]KAI5997865.1 hypothetical protein F5J12DRAFT_725007 [Pisolithus orientalis]